MLVKPLPGLPYYLITYHNKRSGYLFIAHILAFVFLCQSVILLFVSLVSYFVMMAHKKNVKLFFAPDELNWIKPSAGNKEYFVKHSIQLITCLVLVFLFALLLPPQYYYLYMLNASLLLPLFAVTAYYILRAAIKTRDGLKRNNVKRKGILFNRQEFREFFSHAKNILLLYILSVVIFAILHNVLIYNPACEPNWQIVLIISLLILVMPFLVYVISVANVRVIRVILKRQWKATPLRHILLSKNSGGSNSYLNCYLVCLFIAVSAITVIPAITFTGYAFHEEKKLHAQTLQLELAKKIQQRRVRINSRLWQTKVLQMPQAGRAFIDSLKFETDKGLYLFNNILHQTMSADTTKAADSGKAAVTAMAGDTTMAGEAIMLAGRFSQDDCSPFYKLITQFLFLPPDHDEFYDNPTHNQFYSWGDTLYKDGTDSLTLTYVNQTDYRNPASFSLRAEIQHFNILENFHKQPLGYLVVLSILVFIILFYRVIKAVAIRVFLVGYFEREPPQNLPGEQDAPWLVQRYLYTKIGELLKPVFPHNTPATFAELRNRENEVLREVSRKGDETVLKAHIALIPQYEKIWRDCSDVEKFTLYDFALDGFTNYKKLIILYQLYGKGLLVKGENGLSLMTDSFRNFVITKEDSPEIKALNKQGQGSWAITRTVFYIILIAVAIFIFISQEEASKRLITIVTSLAALLPVILKLFDKSTFASSSKSGN